MAERDRAKRITSDHVVKAKNRLEQDIIVDCCRTLPPHCKVLLYAILQSFERRRNGVLTGEVYDSYRRLAERLGLQPLHARWISNYVCELENLGLIRATIVSRGRGGRTREILVDVPISETMPALEEDPLLAPVGRPHSRGQTLLTNFDNPNRTARSSRSVAARRSRAPSLGRRIPRQRSPSPRPFDVEFPEVAFELVQFGRRRGAREVRAIRSIAAISRSRVSSEPRNPLMTPTRGSICAFWSFAEKSTKTVFDLGELVDRHGPGFAPAVPGVLDAAERKLDLGADRWGVDVGDPGLEIVHRLERPIDVPRVDRGGESVVDVVGDPHRLVVVAARLNDREDRSENFLLGDPRAVLGLEDRRGDEVPRS